MAQVYKILCKCKLCGEIFHKAVEVVDRKEELYFVKSNIAYLHTCEDGSIGNSEFLGFKLKGEYE